MSAGRPAVVRVVRRPAFEALRALVAGASFAALAGVAACAAFPQPSAGVEGALQGTLFDAPWSWTDDDNEDAGFSRWRGSPLVVTAIYTSCTTRCPRTVDKLRALDAAFRQSALEARFFLVTLDPDNDDLERLRHFRASRGLPETWRLLRGDRDATRGLARFLGVRAIRDDAHIDHDVRIALFDGAGRLVARYDDWGFDVDRAVAGVRARQAALATSDDDPRGPASHLARRSTP